MSISTAKSTGGDNLLQRIAQLERRNRNLLRRVKHYRDSRDYWRELARRQRPPLARDDPRHGTANAYQNLGCRCTRCRKANTEAHREWAHRTGRNRPADEVRREAKAAALARDNHGTEHRYTNHGCRCEACKQASADARARRRAAMSEQDRERVRAYDRERRRKQRAA